MVGSGLLYVYVYVCAISTVVQLVVRYDLMSFMLETIISNGDGEVLRERRSLMNLCRILLTVPDIYGVCCGDILGRW